MTNGEAGIIDRWLALAKANQLNRELVNDCSASGQPDLDNEVAIILLDTVQRRLPSWSVMTEEAIEMTREVKPIKERKLQLLPRHLFTVTWGGSGPGLAWVEAYYCVEVPQLSARIVTASCDSDELTGYLDLAIGWCRSARDPAWGTKRIITSWWRCLLGGESEPWEEVEAAGAVNRAMALRWRADVWGSRRTDEAESWGRP